MIVIREAEQGARGPADPLDALAGEAEQLQAGIDQASGAPVGDGQQQPAPALTNAQCIAMALEIVRETTCAFAKVSSLKRTLSAESVGAIAESVGPVFDKYGVNLSAMTGDYMVEIKAATVAGPLLLVAWKELREEMAAMRAKPVEPAPEAAAAAA